MQFQVFSEQIRVIHQELRVQLKHLSVFQQQLTVIP